jgi:hypothetical protein
MKRLLIVFVLMICLAAVAFATLRSVRHRASTKTEKKKECKERRECTHTCPFSS